MTVIYSKLNCEAGLAHGEKIEQENNEAMAKRRKEREENKRQCTRWVQRGAFLRVASCGGETNRNGRRQRAGPPLQPPTTISMICIVPSALACCCLPWQTSTRINGAGRECRRELPLPRCPESRWQLADWVRQRVHLHHCVDYQAHQRNGNETRCSQSDEHQLEARERSRVRPSRRTSHGHLLPDGPRDTRADRPAACVRCSSLGTWAYAKALVLAAAAGPETAADAEDRNAPCESARKCIHFISLASSCNVIMYCIYLFILYFD